MKRTNEGSLAKSEERGFAEVVRLIEASRHQALQAVNTALIELYWRVGEMLSQRIAEGEWGDAVVPRLAAYIATTQPGVRGFTKSNLFRMKQFYQTYTADPIVVALPRQLPLDKVQATEKVSALPRQLAAENPTIVPALLTQLPWTHHLIILSQSKRTE